MNIRKSFAGLCASLLAFTLLGFGVSWSAWHVLSRPDYIKQTLHSSGIYNAIAQDVFKQDASGLATSAGLPADQPQVQGIISKSLSGDILQGQAEKIIDSGFDWLNGKTDKLDTTVDLSGAKQQVADNISTYTDEHLRSLPACTAADMPAANTDPLQFTCLPPGFDITAAANHTHDTVLNSDAFKNTNLTPDGATVENPGNNTLQGKLQSGPAVYANMQLSIYLQAVLAVLLAVGLVFLSASRRTGMRRVGVIAVWTGILSVGLAWLSSFGVHFLVKKLAQPGSGSQLMQQKVAQIVQIVVDDVRTWWMYYGIVLAALGVILLIIYRVTKPSAPQFAATLTKEEGITSSKPPKSARPGEPPVATNPATPAPRKTPPKKPRNVQ